MPTFELYTLELCSLCFVFSGREIITDSLKAQSTKLKVQRRNYKVPKRHF